MAIIALQRRLSETGRIRIGQQVPTRNGKMRPDKLDMFRLTSSNRDRIEQVAGIYGGTPQRWDGAPVGEQWEVLTEANALDVVLPPSDMAFSQFLEKWSGGGCLRRCDGRRLVGGSEANGQDTPCLCDPDPQQRECNIHSRLSLMLRALPGLGVWRLDTSGYWAATELAGAVEFCQLAVSQGHMLPAKLRLEQRQSVKDGQTRNYAVPVLDPEIPVAQILATRGATVGIDPAPRMRELAAEELEAGDQAPALPQGGLRPVPNSVPEAPSPSVAQQIAEPQPRRASRSPEIPPMDVEVPGLPSGVSLPTREPIQAKVTNVPLPDEPDALDVALAGPEDKPAWQPDVPVLIQSDEVPLPEAPADERPGVANTESKRQASQKKATRQPSLKVEESQSKYPPSQPQLNKLTALKISLGDRLSDDDRHDIYVLASKGYAKDRQSGEVSWKRLSGTDTSNVIDALSQLEAGEWKFVPADGADPAGFVSATTGEPVEFPRPREARQAS